MEFIKIAKTYHLSEDQLNDINNNFMYFKDIFDKSFNTDIRIRDVSLDTETGYPADFLSNFQKVELNIQAIHNFLSSIGMGVWDEEFYKEFTWKEQTQDRYKEIWRWIDWMNEVYDYARRLN